MAKKTTPMMQQYQALRAQLPRDVLLFFRLGDFYELFFEDAIKASEALDLTLTKRNQVPMCGVPYHAAQGYIAKLLRSNFRVAIGEQVGTPQQGKIVERQITEVISRGTVSDGNLLEAKKSNYLAALAPGPQKSENRWGLAIVELSTAEFRLLELASDQELRDALARIDPAELIAAEGAAHPEHLSLPPTPHDGYAFLPDQAEQTLRQHFGVHSLDGLGCADMGAAVAAAGGLLHYLVEGQRRDCRHLQKLTIEQPRSIVAIDANSQLNLELAESRHGTQSTLLHALDHTVTPMGSRKLRHWILHPLRDLDAIEARHRAIAAFLERPSDLEKLRGELKEVRDIERTVNRLAHGSGNARDLKALQISLARLPALKTQLIDFESAPLTAHLQSQIATFTELVTLLESALVQEPPLKTTDGGMIAEGYRTELDEWREGARRGRQWISDLQTREAEASGIKSLKVKYNAVFGYFIEVTKANLDLVPEHYHRKQTTANGERYITEELKSMEDKILGADEKSKRLEYELFVDLRGKALAYLEAIQVTGGALAALDVLAGLAHCARLYDYTRPSMEESTRLHIVDGRHPVLDQQHQAERFVPNDTELDGETSRLWLITGPNMAGKSTYIRQVALLVLMAQIGSYIPAAQATIGLVDRVFTRVGASDDLSRGQSTFMVEMNEAAFILNSATAQSLIILDEIGRGTSTFDGLSIAWSIAEYLHDIIQARCLFATHYHELTQITVNRPAIANYNVAVREWNDEIVFLHKILPGSADKSYGIQVARLAGLPAPVVARAKTILRNLEESELSAEASSEKKKGSPSGPRTSPAAPKAVSPQLSLFGEDKD